MRELRNTDMADGAVDYSLQGCISNLYTREVMQGPEEPNRNTTTNSTAVPGMSHAHDDNYSPRYVCHRHIETSSSMTRLT